MKAKLGKTKEVHTHKVFFKEAGTGKQKSFTCSKDMLQWRDTNPSGPLGTLEKFVR